MKNIIFAYIISLSVAVSQYALRTEHIGSAQHAGEYSTFRASLIKNGNVVRTIERKLPFDIPFPSVRINAENGMFVLCFPFDGFVEMYDATGDKMWEQNFFKEMEPNYERTITVALGKEHVAFLTSDASLPNAKVHYFTSNGAKQWEKELPHTMGYEIAMSSDEKTVVAGSYIVVGSEVKQSAAVLSNIGQTIADFNILFKKAAFSKDNHLLALQSNKEVAIVSVDTKKENGRISKKISNTIFTDICWIGDTLLTQESHVEIPKENRYYYANPIFAWYSKDMVKISDLHIDNITYQRSQLVPSIHGVEFWYDQNKKILQQ